jgi:hypothetical protein
VEINSIRVEYIENVTEEIEAAGSIHGFMELFKASIIRKN